MATVKIATGTVTHGTIVIEGQPFAEGEKVTVLTGETIEDFDDGTPPVSEFQKAASFQLTTLQAVISNYLLHQRGSLIQRDRNARKRKVRILRMK
jgi:hypothetical protein